MSSTNRPRITGASLIVLCLASAQAGALALLHFLMKARFAQLYGDFTSDLGTLPLVTRVVLSDAYGPLTALAVVAACAGTVALARSRARLVAGFSASLALGLIAFFVLFVGLYTPLFELAGNVQQ